MDNELKTILIKYTLIVILTMIYIAIIFTLIPSIINTAFGQSAFDTPNQFSSPQYNQYGQQQYGYQQPYDQYSQQYGQYNQPYQQYGYQQPYGMQQPYMGNYNSQIGIAEIISMIMGGGGIAYGRYTQQKNKENKEVIRDIMAVQLKDMENQRELARVAYTQMPNQGNDIRDAPAVQLEKLDKGIDEFREKTAKT